MAKVSYGGWGYGANAFADGFVRGLDIYEKMRALRADADTRNELEEAAKERDSAISKAEARAAQADNQDKYESNKLAYTPVTNSAIESNPTQGAGPDSWKTAPTPDASSYSPAIESAMDLDKAGSQPAPASSVMTQGTPQEVGAVKSKLAQQDAAALQGLQTQAQANRPYQLDAGKQAAEYAYRKRTNAAILKSLANRGDFVGYQKMLKQQQADDVNFKAANIASMVFSPDKTTQQQGGQQLANLWNGMNPNDPITMKDGKWMKGGKEYTPNPMEITGMLALYTQTQGGDFGEAFKTSQAMMQDQRTSQAYSDRRADVLYDRNRQAALDKAAAEQRAIDNMLRLQALEKEDELHPLRKQALEQQITNAREDQINKNIKLANDLAQMNGMPKIKRENINGITYGVDTKSGKELWQYGDNLKRYMVNADPTQIDKDTAEKLNGKYKGWEEASVMYEGKFINGIRKGKQFIPAFSDTVVTINSTGAKVPNELPEHLAKHLPNSAINNGEPKTSASESAKEPTGAAKDPLEEINQQIDEAEQTGDEKAMSRLLKKRDAIKRARDKEELAQQRKTMGYVKAAVESKGRAARYGGGILNGFSAKDAQDLAGVGIKTR